MAETQQQDVGAGGIGVQVIGHDNRVEVAVGGASLWLDKLHTRKAEPQSIIELLRVDIRATRFVGRADALAMLAAWRGEAARIAVLCVTGRAGAGKTRLAVEACERAEADGWAAGFVASSELQRFHATQNLAHWRLDKDTLIVVDYAAGSLAILKAWFGLLAQSRGAPAGHKLRVLLLERYANLADGWWAVLTRRESMSHASAADLIADRPPYALSPLSEVEDRRALLAEAMRRAAPLLHPPVESPLTPPAAGADASFDERLAASGIENEPLYLLMAGVHAARHGAPAALALEPGQLAFEMAGIEAARLKRFATQRGFTEGGALLHHLAVCVTLQNGCLFEALPGLIGDEIAETARGGAFVPETVAEQLCDYLGGEDGWANGVRPALIGEAFVLDAFKADRFRPAAAQQAVVMRAYERDPEGVVDTLIRCAQDHADGRIDHPAVQWLGGIAAGSDDVDELFRISERLPIETVALREVAAETYWRLQDLLTDGAESDRATFAPVLAWCRKNLSQRLSELGDAEAALDAAQGAVTLYGGLTVDAPDRFTADLADALLNLACCLRNVGRDESALDAAQGASRLYRVLATDHPGAFTSELGAALTALANHLRGLGQQEAALKAAQEAVAHFRELRADWPDAFAPDLAAALITLADQLGDDGRLEAALEAAEEAVDLERRLVAESPDAYTPILVTSLDRLAGWRDACGQSHAALNASLEAVAKSRKLAEERPDAFTPALAASLAGLATCCSNLGQLEAAVRAAQEAVECYSKLANERPRAFRPDLARTLAQLGAVLGRLAQWEAAFENTQKAACVFRELVAEHADAYAVGLGMTLSNVASLHEGAGRFAEALASTEEAIESITPYVLADPCAELAAICLDDYARRAKAAGVELKADLVTPIREALERLRLPSNEPEPGEP